MMQNHWHRISETRPAVAEIVLMMKGVEVCRPPHARGHENCSYKHQPLRSRTVERLEFRLI